MIEEILSNTICLGETRIPNFSPSLRAEAAAFSRYAYDLSYDHGSLTREELTALLEEMGIWTKEDERKFEESLKALQELKVQYFEAFALKFRRKDIKKQIQDKLEEINKEISRKSQFLEYTCDFAQDEAYVMYLLKEVGNPFHLYRRYAKWKLSEEKVRELYFDNTWRSIWAGSKEASGIFGLPMNSLNENQLSLIYWSKTYDSIQQIENCPNSSALEDVLAVDGWMIKYNRKRAAEEKTQHIDFKAAETFIPVSSPEEAREIMELNSAEGKRIIRARSKDLTRKGELDEREFSLVKQGISMKINELSTGG
jgi:hypothetical protein